MMQQQQQQMQVYYILPYRHKDPQKAVISVTDHFSHAMIKCPEFP